MENELDSLENITSNDNRRSGENISMKIDNTILKVKNNYLPDTIDYAVAEMMNDYKEIMKALQSNSGNLAKAKQSIPEVKQKVDDLEHDIKNGVQHLIIQNGYSLLIIQNG